MSDEEQKPKGKGRGTRPRGQRIEVWVNNDEKAELADRAAQSGLSLSAYMKAAGLNAPIRARADLSAVADLVRVNGDLGRVAGLLKLWLAEKRGQSARSMDIEKVMIEFRALQASIREKMSAIVVSRK
ncbi:conjugal transfer protein TraJ [Escherichia coli]|uniref:plasmid mobilization protein n=1 Tax=Gammaproteobacteria TaxID=1236 RepID=UPI00050C927D|nr:MULTISPECIES: conjugal transfer protein TraJ [Gammaproteobacteria]EDH4904203.1 conjugal transfer protein TraJ [Salmonella enterica subsp. enterica serovar Give]EKZ5284716.1 conjugal transfer protein TraJ [Klebsiella aerogenes]HEG1711301.1 conjugal transfer protein TraJ [Enterobacter cloacae]EFB7408001.1 conjugal transfer protein TraJ [Escherichia coli]EFC4208023.1 conjugal transfer protein TraJ [Escherichia coli]